MQAEDEAQKGLVKRRKERRDGSMEDGAKGSNPSTARDYEARGRKGTPITCLETGETFPTVKAAAAWARRTPANISNCLSGRCATSAGYHWVYADAQPSSWRLPVAVRGGGEAFSDIAAAAAWADCPAEGIARCLTGEADAAGGLRWEAASPKSGRPPTAVACLDAGICFPSIRSAAQWAGCTPSRISSCLAGRSKTAGGHLWARISRSK